jgi:transcriptional regulator with XRE-family HTH domain
MRSVHFSSVRCVHFSCAAPGHALSLAVNRTRIGRGGQNPGGEDGPLSRRQHLARILDHIRGLQARGQTLRDLESRTSVSRSTLSDLLRGTPRGEYRVFERLKGWYENELKGQEGPLEDPVDVAIVLERMLSGLPDDERRHVMKRMVDAAAAACAEKRVTPPRWVQRLRQSLEEGGGEGTKR